MSLSILYQDDYLVAVHKPAGLLVHRSWIDAHETQFALQMVRDQIGRRVYPVHRLDKPTSGLLLFALDSATARQVAEQFQKGVVQKKYVAVVRGYTECEGLIEHPLKIQRDKIADQRASKDKPPQEASTEYHRLATVELPYFVDRYPSSRYSLLEVRPLTGRKHQIRRHMKHISHPIIGDAKYGKSRHNHFFAEHFQCSRLLLASTQIQFQHPVDNKDITICAPLQEDFYQLLCHLGWDESLPAPWRPRPERSDFNQNKE